MARLDIAVVVVSELVRIKSGFILTGKHSARIAMLSSLKFGEAIRHETLPDKIKEV